MTLDRDALLAAARAAREAALAADTLAVHLRRLADSAPPAPEMPAAHHPPAGRTASVSTHQASEATGGAELSPWPPDQVCKCWFVKPGGKRIPNRWCALPEHASEWRTLAEQRAGAGEGSPELDPSERGLR